MEKINFSEQFLIFSIISGAISAYMTLEEMHEKYTQVGRALVAAERENYDKLKLEMKRKFEEQFLQHRREIDELQRRNDLKTSESVS